ncbi:RidA family protein [Spirosoma sp. HMF3257]|uniref:RidA family protein n=1 Tax=Spirosoma telluris TaxID=2183553 RepID=A0A327NKM1_9BACT|nr:RidA family protein [Spirosoma telluris]RAI75345.1 RidA family protein [Spirosoma telluris]
MSAKKSVVTGSEVPQSHLPFSPGVISGNYLFVSGQASVDDQGTIVTDTFAGECRRSFDNLKRIVESAGATLNDAVQVRNYVGRQEDLAEFNTIYREYFREPFPARTTLIGCLGDVLKFEVDAVIAL